MMHAIAGILTVWYTYRIGRLAWSPRVGLIAMALIAVSDFAIQFSRTAGESTIAILTWAVCFYYVFKAIKTRKPLDYVWSGIAAGLTQYSYASGKLLPVFLVIVAVYLLVRWGLTGFKRILPGLALLGLAAALTFLPNAAFIVTQRPDALSARSNAVNIFSPANQPGMFTAYGTNNWGIIVPRQFALTYSAFDTGQEHGPFYPTQQPVLPVPWAALWLLGTAYVIYRAGDARYAILGLWLLSGLAGAALTNDTPTLQRVAGMVPTLGLIPAVFLDRLAASIWMAVRRVLVPWRSNALKWAANLAIAVLMLAIAGQTLPFYFGPYTAQAHYIEFTLAGRYAEKLDPQHDLIYAANLPALLGDSSPTTFLAKDIAFHDYNPSEVIPITADGGKNVHFLFSPPHASITDILQSYYPDTTRIDLRKPDGTPIIAAHPVGSAQLDAQRYVIARYGPPNNTFIERPEPRIGTAQDPNDSNQIKAPAWLSYPTNVEWEGGLIVPAYGTYRVDVDAPSGATLSIDGRTLITAPAGAETPTEARLVLARGVHYVALSGTLEDVDGRIELKWSTQGPLVPIARRLLWGGPVGVLLGESYPSAAASTWYTEPIVPTRGAVPLISRRDGFLSWLSINAALNGGRNVFALWHGELGAPVTGDYILDATGNGQLSMWVDGKLVGAARVPGVEKPLPVTLSLEAGQHQLELRFGASQDNAALDLWWQPPGQQRQLIPSTAFAPLDGGAWPATERPGVLAPDQALIAPLGK
jgi:hypothetical protein